MTDEEIKEATDEYIEHLHRVSLIVDNVRNQVRTKPLLGGPFGHGGFVLASHFFISKGLDRVDFFVCEADSMFVVAWGDVRADAVNVARKLLGTIFTVSRLGVEVARHKAACTDRREERERQRQKHHAARREEDKTRDVGRVRSIGRRRQRIYDEAEGKCHYCSVALTLDGKWHIEHKMPKALGGGNEPGNLVASCVSCNHKKRDTTDIEFKARLAKDSAPSLPVKEQA